MTVGVGTASYMAPEVLKSSIVEEFDEKKTSYNELCDVYSFGILIYVVLTENIHPYGKRNDLEIIVNVQNDKNFRPDLENVPDLVKKYWAENDWLKKLMIKCWSYDPSDRPSMKEVINILRSRKNNFEESDEQILYQSENVSIVPNESKMFFIENKV